MDKTAVKEALIALKARYRSQASHKPYYKDYYDKKRIRSSLKSIKKQCTTLIGKELSDQGNIISQNSEWLSDNYYLVEREGKLLLKSPVKLSKRLMIFIRSLLEGVDCEVTIETIRAFYEIFCKDDFLNDGEIESVGSCLIGCLTVMLNERLKSRREIRRIISSLRYISTLDFTPFILGFSPTERLLRSDPADIYSKMDKATQALYKSKLKKIAKRRKVEPKALCEELIALAAREEGGIKNHIGYFLFEQRRRSGFWYFALIAVFLGGLAALALFQMNRIRPSGWNLLFLLLLLLPLYEAARNIAGGLAAKLVRAEIIPKLRLDRIPPEHTTLSVITALVSGEADVVDLAAKIEKYFLSSYGKSEEEKNLFYGLLCDLPEAKTARRETDIPIINSLTERIDSLNIKYGGGFYLFLRERRYSKKQGVYLGYERKRGAVIELVNFIKGEETSIREFCGDRSALERTRYIVTLDSDTDMGLEIINKLVGAMAHPLNKPVLSRSGMKRVIAGYGIMQPVIATSLESSYATPFSLLMSGAGGFEPYSRAAFDIYQAIFQKGLFCGKGIFDVDCFYAVMKDAFPDGAILSHDILEGTRLSCGLLNDVYFSDGIPKNAVSYYKRAHRWARGDVQALRFAGKYVKNKLGERKANAISPLSKFVLTDNLLRLLLPVFAVAAIAASVYGGEVFGVTVTFYATLYLLLPIAIEILRKLFSLDFQPLYRRFFTNALSGIYRGFLLTCYHFSSLFYLAYSNIDAVIRALWRMKISGKKLLEWQAASETEKLYSGKNKSGFLFYLLFFRVSVLGGALFLVFPASGFHRLLGILFLLFPVICYYSAKPYQNKPKVSEKTKDRLIEYVRDMWGFFEDYVTESENWLPPDNISLSPVEEIASRTSPTNIGLYLLSVLAARDFGIIQTEAMYASLEKTIGTIESLEKYYGHLYNWYDTTTLAVIGGGYVSTVDSGNFITDLVALVEGLKEYVNEKSELLDLIVRLNTLISNTDFRVLYHSKRQLFYLGINTETGSPDEIYYDLYMSEARSTSYYAVAMGIVSKEHWVALCRTLLSRGFHLGAASWSGTAFEYFMPPLLLPIYENSFEEESLKFAFFEQLRETGDLGTGKVYGISESQFFAFDNRMNYQYKAFGVPSLSLKRERQKEIVISPYSCFLMLAANKRMNMKNLSQLKSSGMYGKYGFYEAIDFNRARTGGGWALVKSYMSHHVGMSIVAAANAVYDNLFVRRFMGNLHMRAAAELLKEKIPVDAIVFNDVKTKGEGKEHIYKGEPERVVLKTDINRPVTALISGKECYLLAQNTGVMSFCVNKSRAKGGRLDEARCMNRPAIDTYDFTAGIFAFIHTGDGMLSNYIGSDGTVKRKFIYSTVGIEYHAAQPNLSMSAEYILSPFHTSLTVKVSTRKKNKEESVAGIYFEPALTAEDDYQAHPMYHALMFEAEFDEAENCLFLKKNGKHGEAGASFIAISTQGNFEFETRKDRLFKNQLSDEEMIRVFCDDTPLSGTTGACINPAVLVKTETKGLNNEAFFFIGCGNSRSEALAAVKNEMDYAGRKSKIVSRSVRMRNNLLSAASLDGEVPYALSEKILAASFPSSNGIHKGDLFDVLDRDYFYRHGISCDLPIVCCRVFPRGDKPDDAVFEKLDLLIGAYKLHSIIGLRYDLVLLIDEQSTVYQKPVRERVDECIAYHKCSYLFGTKGGIFIISPGESVGAYLKTVKMLEYVSSLYISDVRELLHENGSVHDCTPKKIVTAPDTGTPLRFNDRDYQDLYAVYGGYFIDKGFLIDKEKYNPVLAWSHVLSGYRFGTLVNDRSLGYTWFSNSREKRLSFWENDSSGGKDSEKLYLTLKQENAVFDLCAMARRIVYSGGAAEYYGTVAGYLRYRIEVFVHPKLLFKCVNVQIQSSKPCSGKLYYAARPVMNYTIRRIRSLVMVKSRQNEIIFRERLAGIMASDRGHGYLAMPYEKSNAEAVKTIGGLLSTNKDTESRSGPLLCLGASFEAGKQTAEKTFVLGYSMTDRHHRFLDAYFEHTPTENIRRQAQAFSDRMTDSKKTGQREQPIPGEEASLSYLYDFWLKYQSVVCRFFARSGLYQSSGAFGYRDQLQDSLIFLGIDPKYMRIQILRACAHQFEEGDVQHWWHNIKTKTPGAAHWGVRTRCSDDYLWLPYAVWQYIDKTGDEGILDMEVSYLADRPLKENEEERYSLPMVSGKRETVYEHCKRALDLLLRRGCGRHGVPFIGSCDWNDGFSKIGAGGGESVWLAFFARIVIHCFCRICAGRQDGEAERRYLAFSHMLRENIEKNCFSDGYYVRAFFGNGTPVGAKGNGECEIDLLPQAFSSLCHYYTGDGDVKRITSALDNAYGKLFNKKNRILKLFTPPFAKSELNVGYIKGYPKGLRENGGQYTHGAVWGVLGFYLAPDKQAQNKKRAMEMLSALNPANPRRDGRYLTEPYVLCGDVYSNPDHEGRGGWSWYTGSANWYYNLLKLILEEKNT